MVSAREALSRKSSVSDSSFEPEYTRKRANCGADNVSGSDGQACRRSTRTTRRPSYFNVVHEARADRDTMAAIKRSRLETQELHMDYASFVNVPTIYANAEEFRDPVKLWHKYSRLGERYGAIKVVPVDGWRGTCPLDTDRVKFKVREQRIENLCNGKGFSHPSYSWDCERMKAEDTSLKNELFGCEDPSVEQVEHMYWALVKKGSGSLVVKYATDLNVYSREFKDAMVDVRGTAAETDVWNMRNLPKCPGSLLRYFDRVIPGVNSPWFYIGMCLTSFCWHTEDNYFGAVNYHHFGAPKATRLETLLKDYSAHESEEFALYSLRIQVPPDVLIANRIPVYRVVQRENEFVFAWPRAYHSGLNTGYNGNEACNIAPVSWLTMGYESLVNYKFIRKTCVSFYSLVMSGVCNYRDFGTADLARMIHSLSLLVSQEFTLRSSILYPMLQMYLHLDCPDVFDVQKFMDEACLQEFDAESYVEALKMLWSDDDDSFLRGCMLLSYVSMRDCDLCDTPTFGSCLMCLHCNCTVCISCQAYHPCNCDTRVVLYRYPLQAFNRIISILSARMHSLNDDDWQQMPVVAVPAASALSSIDASSVFSVDTLQKLLNSADDVFPFKSLPKSEGDVEPSASVFSSSSDLESVSTTDECFSCEPSKVFSLPYTMAWQSCWFDDLRAASERMRPADEVKVSEGESRYGEIALSQPFGVFRDVFASAKDARALALVTKLTVRYMMLSFEGDCSYASCNAKA
ncbi:jmjC transcription factor, putative [Babesia bigemina]|uniref:JmjC transcription factor, putative n=1 Tax=Babesia bigemina TaxID=5866 RepID=A0A061DB16_BABBI|nr:jmjC transcription factor, putative [Babesia bigemina]CDR97861.1 jmjC transcription factor, putative [Babesia bigemina]|eukprot:XP_012770047.1 jmjC transcription factor, putative [Babesia bigemina]